MATAARVFNMDSGSDSKQDYEASERHDHTRSYTNGKMVRLSARKVGLFIFNCLDARIILYYKIFVLFTSQYIVKKEIKEKRMQCHFFQW